jgi:hypothetical protein
VVRTTSGLVSLQGHVRPSVQVELDLYTSDRWEERDRKKENVIFVPLNDSLIRDSCECVCVLYYCLSHSTGTSTWCSGSWS